MSNKQHGKNQRSAEQREIDGPGTMSRDLALQHMETALALVATARGMLMDARVRFPENEGQDLSRVLVTSLVMLDPLFEILVDYSAEYNARAHPLDAMIAASQSMANQVAAMWQDMNRMAQQALAKQIAQTFPPKESTDD